MASDVINLVPTETFEFQYRNVTTTGAYEDAVSTFKAFPEGANLTQVCEQFRKFLVASGFDYVTEISGTTTAGTMFSSLDAEF